MHVGASDTYTYNTPTSSHPNMADETRQNWSCILGDFIHNI